MHLGDLDSTSPGIHLLVMSPRVNKAQSLGASVSTTEK